MIHQEDLDRLTINTLRMLAVDAIEKANSGHPGMVLGAAPMAYVLWMRILKHHPAHPAWPDRDRFILSAGHASMLHFGLLHLAGYGLEMEEIVRFRQLGSKTPGHPERNRTPGVEVTTGPLGQGFAMAVGMAMAEQRLAATFNPPDEPSIVDHFTYALLSDGDLMEGISHEAASLAGHLKLGRLIALYDKNNISIEGSTDLTFTEDVVQRFEACHWQVLQVGDGEDLDAIEQALLRAKAETNRPTLIVVKTLIGHGSPKQGDASSHGAPLGAEAVAATRRFFHWPDTPFHIPPEVREHCRKMAINGQKAEDQWREHLKLYTQRHPEMAKAFQDRLEGVLDAGWIQTLEDIPFSPQPMATRAASGKILNALAEVIPDLWGGSADLGSSVNTDLDRHPQRIIHFGVREHAMGAIVNGLSAHGGFIPYCGTFFSFSNYMIPAMRLGALMHLKAIHLLSHDSIAVGEDGPTHQPVEHLAHLRAIPGLTVIRPADAHETREAWRIAITHPGPVALILSRQKVPWIGEKADAIHLHQGAYIRKDCPGTPQLILMASGSELSLALACHTLLEKMGYRIRLVSMPSWELFELQSPAYQEEILPSHVVTRLAIEAASPQGWHRWTGFSGGIIAVNDFGVSGPFEEVFAHFGFTTDHVVATACSLMEKQGIVVTASDPSP